MYTLNPNPVFRFRYILDPKRTYIWMPYSKRKQSGCVFFFRNVIKFLTISFICVEHKISSEQIVSKVWLVFIWIKIAYSCVCVLFSHPFFSDHSQTVSSNLSLQFCNNNLCIREITTFFYKCFDICMFRVLICCFCRSNWSIDVNFCIKSVSHSIKRLK